MAETCRHQWSADEDWHLDLHFHVLHDDPAKPDLVDHRIVELKLVCRLCGEPMHFLGPPVGLRFDGPSVSVDGTTINLPFAPGRRIEVPRRLEFQLPRMKGKS